MTCADVRRLMNPYFDGELDLVRQVEVEEHLRGCTGCAGQEQGLRSLKTALAAPGLYHLAPAGLRARLGSRTAKVVSRRRRTLMRLTAVAAGVLLLVATAAAITMVSRARTTADERLAEWVVADHVRSLQLNHLTDVESSKQHTVKPWFQREAKIDFSPNVPDLDSQGFTLAGGRLDYLADHPIAALVYMRHSHIINLFTWPAAPDERPVHRLSRQGYHIRYWQHADMVYWAVSDLNDEELDEFVGLCR
jgi:anti-sigma factor RsiW